MDKQYYKVVITKIGGGVARLTAARALRALKSISLSEALDLIDNAPYTVHEGSKAEADWLASKLRQTGTNVIIKEIVTESKPKSMIMQTENQDKSEGRVKMATGKPLFAVFAIIIVLIGAVLVSYNRGIKIKEQVEPLIAALRDKNWHVREKAAEALEKITGRIFGEDPVKWQEWWEENKETFLKGEN
ncbi:MAG: 50S ribosomal protein L7 [Syntrophomonadaceae bacterium]|nr:50S ribosomal protein L7 [Bacillota bacterium]MBT9137580.1 50S ribosomal protein L7 [Bacillota bacterium]MBT9146526.1 50S ribosomal protein L7 [Bacillota bacterium]